MRCWRTTLLRARSWTKALEYICKAAEKATQAFAISAAFTLYGQALKVVDHLDEAAGVQARMAIHQARANLYFTVGDFSEAWAEGERFLGVARQVEDGANEGAALATIAQAAMWAEDFDSALAHAGQAIEVARTVGAQSALASGRMITGSIYSVTGRLSEAREELDQALTIGRSVGDTSLQTHTLFWTSTIENWEGAYDKAVDLAAEGVRIARTHNLVAQFLRCLYAQAISLTGKGNYDQALPLFEEGLAIAEKIGDEAYIPRYLNGLGWLYLECEAFDRSLDFSGQGSDMAQKMRRYPTGIEKVAFAEVNRGDAFLAQGDRPLAQEVLEGVHRMVKDSPTHDWMRWRYTTHLFVSLGEFWMARGEPRQAQAFAAQCLEIATRTSSWKYVVKGWRLHAEVKRPGMARQTYQAAHEVIDGIKADLRHPELRAGLDNSPLIQHIYDLSA
ncbi:MAG: tetratricopeptide repeat protein [bacterium]|nr:tetratricopeptide repeat protein [bacterium]